jgi:transglutaminase-like putative cysteine protease
MQLISESSDIDRYLASSEIINFEDPDIQKTAMMLSKGTENEIQLIKTVYEFVRDNISHSMDIGNNNVTYKAADVLKYKHGLCFAKSHLLAAVLRFLEIPTGFCYQKLEFDGGFGLHGLNAVFIESLDKWIRLDARGNENGINAQFNIDKELLAYSPRKEEGEVDFPIIHAEPDRRVMEILSRSNDFNEALERIFYTKW